MTLATDGLVYADDPAAWRRAYNRDYRAVRGHADSEHGRPVRPEPPVIGASFVAPAGARTASLDTGQRSDIGDTAKLKRDLDRLYHNDRAKGVLATRIDEASAAWWARYPEGGTWLAKLAQDVRGCRYGQAFRDATCGAYMVRPKSCHCRVEADCERARAGRQVARLAELADAMESPKLLTLTAPNSAPGELELGVEVLQDAWAHLRRHAIFKGGPCLGGHRAVAFTDVQKGIHHKASDEVARCDHPPHRKDVAAAGNCRCARCIEVDVVRGGHRVTVNGCPRCVHEQVAGGVSSIEVTWSVPRANWHPHIHALMAAGWILQREIREAWRAVTCDAVRRAELRATGQAGRIPKCPHRHDDQGRSIDGCRGASQVWISKVKGEPGSDRRRAAVRETLKYVSKGLLGEDGELLPGATPADLGELLLTLRGRRLLNGWGSFRGTHDVDDDEMDPEEVFVGPDVPDYMVGLPRQCPSCSGAALWEMPIDVRRVDCTPIGAGRLEWRPHAPPGRA